MIDQQIGSACCGCKMCGDLCPKNAITFQTDSEGFWYPSVNRETCVKCGLCVKKCPVLQETENKTAFSPDVHCAWIQDEDIRLKSTSGGVYYALAETMLQQNGYIAGCVFSDDWKSAKHIVGRTKADLERIFRSKYFQSDTAGVYRQVKALLEQGERLLFCGSPCQNAALREYLGREYENLVQCDFICRGINSPKAHRAHVEELEKRYGAPVEFFNFKNKSAGWTMLGLLEHQRLDRRVYHQQPLHAPILRALPVQENPSGLRHLFRRLLGPGRRSGKYAQGHVRGNGQHGKGPEIL